MGQIKYQITLSMTGNHSVSVAGDDQEAINEGLAWARGIYLKLQEQPQSNTSAVGSNPSEAVHHQLSPSEPAPVCAIHSLPMVSVNGAKGQVWSCHQKLQDGSWCPYKPPKQP